MSEFLQERLRETRAEQLRVSTSCHPRRSSLTFRLPSAGRDDSIFAIEQEHKLQTSGRFGYASPVESKPSRPGSRRMSSSSTAATSTPRALGAHEVEDRVDKLTKENFDLKMEVVHRREKEAKLTERMQALTRVEQDNNELLNVVAELKQDNSDLVNINDDLVLELELRDRAVDEAVVKICELEDRANALQRELEIALEAASQQRAGSATSNSHDSRVGRSRFRTFPHLDPDSQKAKVCAESLDHNDETSIPELFLRPSFLNLQEAATDALRRVCLRNNGQNYDFTLMRENITSPSLGIDSRRSLGSTFEDQSHTSTTDPMPNDLSADVGYFPSQPRIVFDGKSARINRWVKDGAISPPTLRRSRHSISPAERSYQSLNDVLRNEDQKPTKQENTSQPPYTASTQRTLTQRTLAALQASTDTTPTTLESIPDALPTPTYPLSTHSPAPSLPDAHSHRLASSTSPRAPTTSTPPAISSSQKPTTTTSPQRPTIPTFTASFTTQTPPPRRHPASSIAPAAASTAGSDSEYATPRQTPARRVFTSSSSAASAVATTAHGVAATVHEGLIRSSSLRQRVVGLVRRGSGGVGAHARGEDGTRGSLSVDGR